MTHVFTNRIRYYHTQYGMVNPHEASKLILVGSAIGRGGCRPKLFQYGCAGDSCCAGRAGNIASCDNLKGGEATANLLDRIPGTVFAVGDLTYVDGSDEQFARCYGSTWGRFKDRTRPAPGNHEYHSDGTPGYSRYFGGPASDPKKGYYGYDLGEWHIIVLNSERAKVGLAVWDQHKSNGCDKT